VLHGNPQKIMAWQAEMVAIPAPPFGEKVRANGSPSALPRLG